MHGSMTTSPTVSSVPCLSCGMVPSVPNWPGSRGPSDTARPDFTTASAPRNAALYPVPPLLRTAAPGSVGHVGIDTADAEQPAQQRQHQNSAAASSAEHSVMI